YFCRWRLHTSRPRSECRSLKVGI
ncbi:uncharacterized protein METZ01_LOCUS307837, partial [marine metagenome]